MNGALVNIISASAEGIAAVAAKTFLVSNIYPYLFLEKV